MLSGMHYRNLSYFWGMIYIQGAHEKSFPITIQLFFPQLPYYISQVDSWN